MSVKKEIPSVFIANYLISDGSEGGISCTLNLFFDPFTSQVDGRSTITQPVPDMVPVKSSVSGHYQPVYTMDSKNTLVVLTGFSDSRGALVNLELRMVLNEGLKSGTANYSFLDQGEWVQVENQQVELIEDTRPYEINRLADKLAGTPKL